MLVWPFPPTSSTETWSNLTDVQETYSGENRRPLRKGAFLSCETSSSLSETELGYAEGIYRAALTTREDVYVPLWGQEQKTPGGVSVGALTLPVDPTLGDWFLGYAMLWESPLSWEIVEVEDAHLYAPGETRPGSLALVSSVVGSYQDPLVLPVAPCFFTAGLKVSRGGFNAVSVDAAFRAVVDASFPETSWETVGGYLLASERDLQAGSGSSTIVRPETFVDNGVGPVSRPPSKAYFTNTRPFTLRPQSLVERQRIRDTLLYLQGRVKEFLRLSSVVGEVNISGTTSSGVELPLSYAGPRVALAGRRLYIKTTTTEFLRTIVSVGSTNVTLNQSLPTTTEAERLRVALADVVRLDTDEIELKTAAGNGAVISLTTKDL